MLNIQLKIISYSFQQTFRFARIFYQPTFPAIYTENLKYKPTYHTSGLLIYTKASSFIERGKSESPQKLPSDQSFPVIWNKAELIN